ncbi:aldo/keto reductase [Nocardia sp. CDC153]|uniref:aldo/keto reductase n=1 Tax=Nocardia sp. CDC153 TaxID=3112167 RepID=UPI002DB93131|nr:aldo/keto reductase [Nocardia sp. CDC153]MEC3953746.1 aldo/keto reductase [Nocardia sp. CDC153]
MTSDELTPDGRARVLADGGALPLLGLGVWQVPDGPECVNAVRWALDAGYRHIDTAQAYGNEASVGKALRDSGIDRGEVFITTKFFPRGNDPVGAMQQSLRRLGVDQVDLYLVHWPQGGPTRAWSGMERAAERGYARSIGVSNFSAAELESVTAVAERIPSVNQVSYSPVDFRQGLLEACRKHGIALEAYSPLGTGRLLRDTTVAEIAAAAGRTPAHVLLRWVVQRGIPAISKSVHRNRIEENLRIFDFTLSDEDMARLDALDRTGHTAEAQERPWW